MSGHESFDQAFDAAIDALRAGVGLPAVLAAHPAHRDELLPLLAVAGELRPASRAVPPPSPRLAQNFRMVRAAVQDAQDVARAAPWWRRPVTVASLSLPAGILALVAIGVAGAAAGGAVAVSQTGMPAAVEHIVTLGAAGGGSASHSRPVTAGNGNSTGSGDATSLPGIAGAPTEGHANNGGGAAASGTPENPNAPSAITVSGTIQDVRGGTFTLHTAGQDWNVNIDGNTVLSGTIAEGATATVAGTATAGQNLHATSVDVTAGPGTPVPAAAATDTPIAGPGNPTHTPAGNGQGNGDGNGNSGADGAGDGHGTPPKTPASGNPNAGATGPPGAGNGANGNGNGGGPAKTH